MEIKLRDATKEDVHEILKIIGSDSFSKKWDKPLAEKYYRNKFNSNCDCLKADKVYVGVIDGKRVAVIGYCPDRFESKISFWLGWFYIHKEFQNKKYGYCLLEKLVRKLKEENHKAEKLFVDTSSHRFYRRAIKFYIDYGFKFEAILRDYYEQGEDQIILGLKL